MKVRKKIVIGNWKMNVMTLPEAKEIVRVVKRKTTTIKRTEVVFCPPAIYLGSLAGMMGRGKSAKYKLGAQNIFGENSGPYTGEISANQLKQFAISYIIVGHSERRQRNNGAGETDEVVAKKIQSVLRADISPVICIGESIHDEEGQYLQFVRNQLIKSLSTVTKGQISDVVIAYEPIWAVGGTSAMSPGDIHQTILYIKKCLREMFGSYASSVAVLYGGDATVENSYAIVKEGFVDGLLVGRESIDVDNFSEIIKQVDEIR